MDIVDAQVHIWEKETVSRPWASAAARRLAAQHYVVAEATDEMMIRSMDDAGVNGAILVTPSVYANDNSYALDAAVRHPDRFRVVGRVSPFARDVARSVDEFAVQQGAVGLRLVVISSADSVALRCGAAARFLAAAESNALVLCIFAPGRMDEVGRIAAAHPKLQIIVDHFGVAAPPDRSVDTDPFDGIGEVRGLAKFQNVAVKITGGPALSSGGYPFVDVLSQISLLNDVFGPDRLLWGSDWTRIPNATYAQGVNYLLGAVQFDEQVRRQMMAGSLRRVFGWPLSAIA